jgi:hypothetical protein
MFYYNSHMSGEVPTFSSSVYTLCNLVSDYLTGCNKSSITNNGDLESRLKPSSWN